MMSTASLKEVHEVVLRILEELKSLKKDLNDYNKEINGEALAAKIINDITEQIKNCPCNKEILEDGKRNHSFRTSTRF
uniref:Virion-associated protein n=1 Tax=Physostegia virginiana caulimovirus 1 TaxID=3075963 RepID=A0AA96C684_9VIRU|nr:DNA-binding protein [Physostegia virginiana caulimovirus 1]